MMRNGSPPQTAPTVELPPPSAPFHRRTTRVLVTGGAGFVGAPYVRLLLGPDGPPHVAVTVLDKSADALARPGGVGNTNRCAFVQGDICDAELVGKLVSEHDQVVHFASESEGDHVPPATEVYGSIRAGSWPQSAPLRPNSPYAASKGASDLIALAQHRTHGLDVRVIRSSDIFGPHQFPDRTVPLLITRLLTGRSVPLYGDGLRTCHWIHLDDQVRAVELVRTHGRPGEIYNIGGDEVSIRDLIALLLHTCGAHWQMVQPAEGLDGQVRRSSVDFTKIRSELGYAQRKDLAVGLAETVDWYRTHRSWWEPLLEAESGAACTASD